MIMITALTDARPAVEALKSGAYDYLLKPFELDELKLVVAKALETHRLKLEVARLKEQQRKRFPDQASTAKARPFRRCATWSKSSPRLRAHRC